MKAGPRPQGRWEERENGQLQLVRVYIVQLSTVPHVRRNVRGLGNGLGVLLSAVSSERET